MLSQSNAQLDASTFGPYCNASIQSRVMNISMHRWYAGSRKHPQPEKHDDLVCFKTTLKTTILSTQNIFEYSKQHSKHVLKT
ncbi:hypothetical protein AMTR_s00098p00038500 [Amborella trichopoda]|uniref:Uncharacterized protein n=1 Tax=Amborella trichopoda TaxID=13333 RepID=W1NS33_AMBTC|nr:hypothetical protein AMTR_s00098p00038500 [Amborella trichopoda]